VKTPCGQEVLYSTRKGSDQESAGTSTAELYGASPLKRKWKNSEESSKRKGRAETSSTAFLNPAYCQVSIHPYRTQKPRRPKSKAPQTIPANENISYFYGPGVLQGRPFKSLANLSSSITTSTSLSKTTAASPHKATKKKLTNSGGYNEGRHQK